MSERFGFGRALKHMQGGYRVARDGWNGAGMFAYLVPAASYQVQTGAAKAHFGEGSMVPYRAYFALKTAQDDVATWTPSNSDILAVDWFCLDAVEAAPATGFHRYRSHKVVEAAEVEKVITFKPSQGYRVELVGVSPGLDVRGEVFARGVPAPGDFLIRYNAGTPKEYLSWSPRDVFLDGYTRISED